jgi:hypothetical protein
MATLFRIALVVIVAAGMVIFGVFLIAAAGDGRFDFNLLGKSVVCRF